MNSIAIKKKIGQSSLFFGFAALISLVIFLITVVILILSLFTTNDRSNLISTLLYSGIACFGLGVIFAVTSTYKND
jgi:hypothetical protein